MGNEGEIGRLHAEMERLAAEVRELRERLDDRDMEQAARDDALNRAMSGGRRPWSPRLLDGAAGAKAALVALTVAKGAATVEALRPRITATAMPYPARLPVGSPCGKLCRSGRRRCAGCPDRMGHEHACSPPVRPTWDRRHRSPPTPAHRSR